MSDQEEDLRNEGLVAVSYDNFFAIEKRIRKFQDFHVPTRQGLATSQIGTFFVVFFVSAFVYLFILAPIFSFVHIPHGWRVMLLFVFGPPVVAAWRVTRPMPHGKTIPGTAKSWIRYALDDRYHRRGVPVPTNKRPSAKFIQHYLREFVVSEEFVDEIPAETNYTDPHTENLRRNTNGNRLDLQQWMDQMAIENWEKKFIESRQKTKKDITAHDRRGRV